MVLQYLRRCLPLRVCFDGRCHAIHCHARRCDRLQAVAVHVVQINLSQLNQTAVLLLAVTHSVEAELPVLECEFKSSQ